MNTYDVKCLVCGVVNHSLFLEETDGWMECEHCGHTAKYCWEPQTKKQIPVFVIRNLQAYAFSMTWSTTRRTVNVVTNPATVQPIQTTSFTLR